MTFWIFGHSPATRNPAIRTGRWWKRVTRPELTLALAFGLAACGTAEQPAWTARLTQASFADLPGWSDAHAAPALAAYAAGCAKTVDTCRRAGAAADDDATARRFIESHFTVLSVGDPAGSDEGVFTGYYEPEIAADRVQHGAYRTPLYALPGDKAVLHLTRSQIDAGGLPKSTPVLSWAADPVEAFFLQVQGSGRLRYPEGTIQRVAFAGKTDQPYHAIARTLVDRGALTREEATAPAIKRWLHAHPGETQQILESNPSYVFFRMTDTPPTGSAGRPLQPGLSLAVDPAAIPMGSLLWVDSVSTIPGGQSFRGLVRADDTGSAIKGAVRGDVFFGAGGEAASRAGSMNNHGRYWLLVLAEP